MSNQSSTQFSDLRSQKSWHKIRIAFETLVLSKRYDEISTSEIIAEAKVARSTFYEHFSNKNEVLGKSLNPPLSALASCVKRECSPETVSDVLQHFWEHRSFCRIIFSSSARKSVDKALVELLKTNIEQILCEEEIPLIISVHHAATQIASAQLSLIETWILGKAPSTPVRLADVLKRSTQALFNALRSNQANHSQ